MIFDEETGFAILNEFDHIIDNLYLGAFPKTIGPTYKNPEGFKFVFNFSENPTYNIEIGQRVITCPFQDSHIIPDVDMLNDIADLVNSYSKKGPTLVHCAAGLNRSALVMGLALIKRGMKSEEAIKLMRDKRDKSVLCNDRFELWLLQQTLETSI